MTSRLDIEAAETRINLAIGKLLRNFNFLELNLGYCIRYLQYGQEAERAHPWLARSSIQEKVIRFAELLREQSQRVNDQDLDSWCQRAAKARLLRNFYAHCIWRYLPRAEPVVELAIPPWRKELVNDSYWVHMTLESLETDADEVEAIFRDFNALRKKYRV